MKHLNVTLSIDKLDKPFTDMEETLTNNGCNVTVVGCDEFCLNGTDIFIGKKMTAQQLAQADSLKAIFAYKTGADEFPLEELAKRNIPLVNSHVNSDLIAEYAVSLAISLVNRIVDFDRNMRQGNWCLDNPCWDSIFELKVGLVGYGGIGQATDKLLRKLGVATYTLNRGKVYPIPTCDTLEELCDTCDLLILSLPKTDDTNNMFDKKIFARLKGKYIVNVGRSNAVDEAALYEALLSGLKGAAIDTWRQKARTADERLLPYDHPFEKLDNVILSSHKAMQTSNGHARYVADTLESVLLYLNEGTLRNVVDLKKGY